MATSEGTGAHGKKEPAWWAPFLGALAKSGNVSLAARSAGIGRELIAILCHQITRGSFTCITLR